MSVQYQNYDLDLDLGAEVRFFTKAGPNRHFTRGRSTHQRGEGGGSALLGLVAWGGWGEDMILVSHHLPSGYTWVASMMWARPGFPCIVCLSTFRPIDKACFQSLTALLRCRQLTLYVFKLGSFGKSRALSENVRLFFSNIWNLFNWKLKHVQLLLLICQTFSSKTTVHTLYFSPIYSEK